MSKGLEALEKLRETLSYEMDGINFMNEVETIEKDLKMLDIFQGALTIEHHEPITVEHNHNNDTVELFVKQAYEIRKNQIEKDMRQALREWVLKNAFPKEIKTLEIISDKINKLYDLAVIQRKMLRPQDQIKAISYFYDLLKEVML